MSTVLYVNYISLLQKKEQNTLTNITKKPLTQKKKLPSNFGLYFFYVNVIETQDFRILFAPLWFYNFR